MFPRHWPSNNERRVSTLLEYFEQFGGLADFLCDTSVPRPLLLCYKRARNSVLPALGVHDSFLWVCICRLHTIQKCGVRR